MICPRCSERRGLSPTAGILPTGGHGSDGRGLRWFRSTPRGIAVPAAAPTNSAPVGPAIKSAPRGFILPALVTLLLYAGASSALEPPALEEFAMLPMVRDVDLSPSGEHVAVMRLPGPGQNYVVDVYETARLDEDPYTLGSEHMDIVRVDWANDRRLLIITRQPVEVPGRRVGYNRHSVGASGKVKTYAWKLLSVGIDGGRWVELPSKSNITRFAFETYVQRLFRPRMISRLPKEEDWVLLEWANSEKSGTEVFKVNVNNGQARPEFKHSADFLGYVFDKEGDARVRSRANRNDNTVTLQFRTGIEGGWSDWTDWLTWDVDADRYVEVLAFESPDYNRAYVRWARDRDTQGIYLFDMKNPDAEPELLFAIDRYDAQDVVVACVSQECVDGDEDPPIVGFYYVGDGPSIYYVDEAAAALQASIDAALPAGNFNRIHDRAKEDKYIIIRSMGPQEPGRYYLLEDRSRLRLLGRASTIEPEQFGERKVIWYEARDGMKLNAVLTLPTHGEPPYPAIAHPHGGPRSRDSLHWNSSFWDEWPQLLATRGYAVLQPNYRGSTGFGFDYYSAGNKEWGYKMQDDVDDGMHYLVEQGIADPDRMAIFGWSYGGYSAMVGALRDPNIYRCAIPGAGVSSMELIEKEAWHYRFRDVIQIWRGGLSPLRHMDAVNVPVLLVHGDRDLIVPIKHSDLFARELEKRGKPYKYLKLVDAAHTVDTLSYRHYLEFYRTLLDFLADDCGLQG